MPAERPSSSPVIAAAWVTAIMAVASLAETPLPPTPEAAEAFSSATYQAVRPPPPTAQAAEQIAAVRDGGRIDVNRADAQTLQLLPGVGPTVSARILADRAENGPYPTLEAMTRVKGIGPRTVERIAALAFAGAPAPEPAASASAPTSTESPAGEEEGHAQPGLHVETTQHAQ